MSWISFLASLACFSRACFSSSLETLLCFWCKYSSLQSRAKAERLQAEGLLRGGDGFSAQYRAKSVSSAEIPSLPHPPCLGLLTHKGSRSTYLQGATGVGRATVSADTEATACWPPCLRASAQPSGASVPQLPACAWHRDTAMGRCPDWCPVRLEAVRSQ